MKYVKDVARIDLGSQQYGTVSKVSGHECALMGIYQLPGANALSVVNAVRDRLEQLAQNFPPGVKYDVVLDTTEFVTASIDEVLVTFVETTLIVMIVILLFLQNWRAVIIPMITIPVSLIATFAVMKLLGFTLNTLTLFGLVLAIAIVVDDAIVVVEDCSRLVDEGKLTPRQGAEKAMQELQRPVIGEVLVLLSVFIPTAFISGITSQLYKQFALTIAVSTAFSGFNALTFTPAMCALFLRKKKQAKFFIYRWFEKGFGAALDAGKIRFRPIMMTALAFVFGVMPMLFANGAGAASRVSLGTAVVFGMAVNAIVGTLFVPNFWELMERLLERYLSKLFAGADKAASTAGQEDGPESKATP